MNHYYFLFLIIKKLEIFLILKVLKKIFNFNLNKLAKMKIKKKIFWDLIILQNLLIILIFVISITYNFEKNKIK